MRKTAKEERKRAKKGRAAPKGNVRALLTFEGVSLACEFLMSVSVRIAAQSSFVLFSFGNLSRAHVCAAVVS